MVGRFRQSRRHDWTQTGIRDSRLRVRYHRQAGAKRSREKAKCGQCRQRGALFHFDLAGICGPVLSDSGFSHSEILDAQALSFNSRPASSSGARQVSALRHPDRGGAAVCFTEVRQRIGLGNVQSPAQPALEDIRQCKEVGTFRRGESGLRRRASRKTPGAGKARPHAGAGCRGCWQSCGSPFAPWCSWLS